MSQDSNLLRETEAIEDIDAGVSDAERDVRISTDEGDDLPMTPPDMQPRGTETAMTGDANEPETIDQRIAQEEPDPNSAYGAPDDEGGLDRANRPDRLGGDDPDSIPAQDDVLGDPASYGDEAPQYGAGDDEPAEEAAMHVEGEDASGDDLSVDDGLDTESDVDERSEQDS